MKITKYLKIDARNLVKNINKICDFFLIDFPEENNFRIYVSCEDVAYEYSSRLEFALRNSSFKNVTMFLCDFDVSNKKTDKKLYLSFLTYNSNHISISLDGLDQNTSEKYFKDIQEKLNLTFYKHNPTSEIIEKNKVETEKCIDLLHSCQDLHARRRWDINNEIEVQDFLYPILKSHFNDLEDELYLPQFANISYKPDFGIPSLKLLIEIKYLRKKPDLNKVQKEINDDSVGYIKSSDKYKLIIVYIYNSSNMPIEDKYIKDLEKNKVVKKVIISPGISSVKNIKKSLEKVPPQNKKRR